VGAGLRVTISAAVDRPASRLYIVLLLGPPRASRRRPQSVVRYSAEDMADIAIDNPPVEPRKRPSSARILLPPLLFFGAVMMAADFTAIDLRPLHVLQIPYLKAMDYAHFIIPGFCALIWLATVRKWPNASAIVSVVLCFILISQIPAYADRRIVRIPVGRFLTLEEREALKSRIAFPIYEQASSGRGNEVFVAPCNEASAKIELRRLGILSGRAAAG